MVILVWAGAILTMLGIAGLIWCIAVAVRARRAGLSDEALKERLQKVVVVNMAALGVSAIGLMCVILGVSLS